MIKITELDNLRTIEKPLTKKEFEKYEKYGNEEREPYLGLVCSWCPYIEDRGFIICPSCDYRYTKIVLIDKLIDGNDVWDKFKDIDSDGVNIKDKLRK